MSYDYNASLQQIQKCRQNAATAASVASAADDGGIQAEYINHLQQAVEAFESLSHHCPMTPVLWMQYAATSADFVRAAAASAAAAADDDDSSTAAAAAAEETEAVAEQTRLSILQLGLQEFPGYALLHLHYLYVLFSAWSKEQQQQKGAAAAAAVSAAEQEEQEENAAMISDELLEESLQTAIEAVGRGSHRNEGTWIAALYQLQAEFNACKQQYHDTASEDDRDVVKQRIAQVFTQRSLVPIKGMNDALADEWHEFVKNHAEIMSSLSSSSSSSSNFDPQHVLQRMEENRRLEAKWFQPLVDLEDDIDVVMNQCEILARFHLAPSSACSSSASPGMIGDKILAAMVDWEPLLQPGGAPQYGMGLGDASVATAFCKYAQTVQQQYCATSGSQNSNGSSRKDDDDDKISETERQSKNLLQDRMPDLVISIYERGVAECPTVESIWLSYIDHLQNELEKTADNKANTSKMRPKIAGLLPTVARRACRNCPYSLTLGQLELRIQLVLANAGCIVLDPDHLVQTAQQALATGFLPSDNNSNNAAVFFQVYRTVIQVIKRRILFLLASSMPSSSIEYDQAISLDKTKTRKKAPTTAGANTNDDAAEEFSDKVLEEVSDLCDDLEELYDTVEADLVKKYKQDQSGRVLLLQDRALTQAHVLSHVRKFILENNNESSATASVSVPPLVQTADGEEEFFMRRLEKAARVHNPPHPDSYLMWIRYYMATLTPTDGSSSSGVQDLVVRHLCKVRGLFEKAIHQVGRPKAAATSTDAGPHLMPFRDFDTALASLGHEWVEFETTFGSDKSLDRAAKAIQRKVHKLAVQPPVTTTTTTAIAIAARLIKLEPTADLHLGPTTTATSAASTENERDTKEHASLKRNPESDIHDTVTKKRKIQGSNGGSDNVNNDEKQQEMDIDNETEPANANDDDDAAALKKKSNRPKVRVGELEFPAHPFTVRVSNLTDDTVDMDLVDLLRPKCGAIVHARIVRERGGNRHDHQNYHMLGKSKGWGLVQFEEREAVEKALALTDTLGLHEKLLQIERSHMPGVSLIPPGMHRVKPKGEGRNSKRNEMRKAKTTGAIDPDGPTSGQGGVPVKQEEASHPKVEGVEKSSVGVGGTKDLGSVLGFRPRAVGKSATSRKKFKVNLQQNEENK
jgi:RNA recognition motif. (a.k.a. RRM, RBD, or RNP domain)